MPGMIPKQGYPPLTENFSRADQIKAMIDREEKEPISPLNKIMGISIAICIVIYIVVRVWG